MAHGPRYGLLTVAGTSTAMVLQLALVALGMTPLLGALGSWFELLRWIGVAYLVYLGVRTMAGAGGRSHQDPPRAEVAAGDVHPGAPGLDDQPEDAPLLRRLLPAVRLAGPCTGAAGRLAFGDLRA